MVASTACCEGREDQAQPHVRRATHPAEALLLLRVHAEDVAALPDVRVAGVDVRPKRRAAHVLAYERRELLAPELLHEPHQAALLAVAPRAVVTEDGHQSL